MDYLKKTRDELIEDLETLRRRLANLEVEMLDGSLDLGPVLNPSQRAEERTFLGAIVEFSPQFGNVDATGVNSSKGGVCFETDSPLCFRLKIRDTDGERVRDARLVWVNRGPDETSQLGFEFIQ
jgi:hypothetical protein